MFFFRQTCAVILILVVFINVSFITAAQENKGSLLRGYRTGYSDGYMAGYRDFTEGSKPNVDKHSEYKKADRVYRSEYGSLEDYRDGYQQGFERGYKTGYERRQFESSLPSDLARRKLTRSAQLEQNTLQSDASKNDAYKSNKTVAVSNNSQSAISLSQTKPSNRQMDADESLQTSPQSVYRIPSTLHPVTTQQATIIIPTDTEIVVEMLADVNTEDSREGDSYLTRVVAPSEIAGSIVEGRVMRLKRPGRVKGNAELQLSFDRIVINEKRWANFNATVVEALPMKQNNIKTIDEEGTVEGKSSVKGDVVKVGASTAAGAGIGVIAGGPIGAAVGAAIGGAFGIGGVLTARGKDINLVQGQQLRIRTNFESQVR